MTAIHFDHIWKQHPEASKPSVKDVSFKVEEGSLVVLLGPSGSGKTTLLKMVNRLVEPTSGQIYLNGKSVAHSDSTDLRRKIGYVIQQVGLFPHMTIAQNIGIVPELLGWPKARVAARVEELLALMDLPFDEFRHRYPSQCSGGQQQRVGVARALAADPGVMLMDEPFGALDAITRAGLQNELLGLQRQFKKTILFVTHDVEEALYLADKIAVLKDGELVQYDTPLNILTQPADAFVEELVGANDLLRRLSQVRVEQVMDTSASWDNSIGRAATIAAEDSVRSALSMLLASDFPALIVLKKGEPVGSLSLEQIRLTSISQESGVGSNYTHTKMRP